MRNGRDNKGGAAQEPASGADTLDSTPGAFIVSTDWRTGPRTRAWDELWRWLLSPDEPDPSGSPAGAAASSDSERQQGR